MQVLCFPLGELQANCYFLIKDNDLIIIDPADEANFLLDEIRTRKLKPVAILATHGHFDHIMAVGTIQLSFPVPFYIKVEDKFLIERLSETAKHFLGYDPIIIPPIKMNEMPNNKLVINKFNLNIVKTPGHTPGSVCILDKKGNDLFTGDTLFKQGVGRTDFSYGSESDLDKSLVKLMKLPGETTIYPGHGEATTVKQELSRLS